MRDSFSNQIERSGHAHRLSDLDRVAQLGVLALRYPVLWESIAPRDPNVQEWAWTDARLGRLRALGIDPIVGLVHHGSGPAYTSLIDNAFPAGLAKHAGQVAQRYPWVERYTPVNEPLTTARFSGLYGFWYPHARDDHTFARCLVNQCRATVEAMTRIREVNPRAQLVQTEDLGRTYSTKQLSYQADFDNERRWLSWDLLCGRVDKHHPMRAYLEASGIGVAELDWLQNHPCPPDIIGINHYVTSDRFLDERARLYPQRALGGNGRVRYADVDAVRVLRHPGSGWRGALQEAWDRYQLPIAMTEVHLGCTREEQLRWLVESWHAAHAARRVGCDIRAFTVWSLFGSYDWDSLLTQRRDHYESGVFDVRGREPRETALAGLIRELFRGVPPSSHALGSAGWWQRPCRLLYPPAEALPARAREAPCDAHPRQRDTARRAPILIIGATGTLGQAFGRLCAERDLKHCLTGRAEIEICDPRAVGAALDRIQPWAVINAAGYVRVDEAERDSVRCFRDNNQGPRTLALACAQRKLPLVTFSSDLVFDGRTASPYVESAAVAPLNVYGRSKAAAEAGVLENHPDALVVRTSAFFGLWDRYNFLGLALSELEQGRQFCAMSDVLVSPTFVPDLVHGCLDLLIDRASGIWHLTNRGCLSWAQFARDAAALAGIDSSRLEARPSHLFGLQAERPAFSALSSERGILLPPLEHALERYAANLRETDTWRQRRRYGNVRS